MLQLQNYACGLVHNLCNLSREYRLNACGWGSVDNCQPCRRQGTTNTGAFKQIDKQLPSMLSDSILQHHEDELIIILWELILCDLQEVARILRAGLLPHVFDELLRDYYLEV